MPEVMVKGTKIHFLEKKAQAPFPKGKVVCVHGSGGNAGLWQKVMDGLAGEYHLLALDLPGHGRSEGQGMKRVSEYRDFLKDFFDALELERIVLGGHSLGGAVVQDFAIHYPAKLSAILLIGTGARLRVIPQALEVMRQMAEGKIEPRFDPWEFSPKASPEMLATAEREWAKTTPWVRYHDLMACDQFDIMREIEKIRLPALMVCGREDWLTPIKYSEFLNNKISGSEMEIIEGAGHMLMLEAPEALSGAILRFLRSLDSFRADY